MTAYLVGDKIDKFENGWAANGAEGVQHRLDGPQREVRFARLPGGRGECLEEVVTVQ